MLTEQAKMWNHSGGKREKAPGKCEQGSVAESALINVRMPILAPASGAAVASKLLLLRHVC